MVCAVSFGQIKIEKIGETFTSISSSICDKTIIKYANESGDFILSVSSDDYNEKETAVIKLGKTKEEAISSILKLNIVLCKGEASYKIDNYKMTVFDDYALLSDGNLTFAFGRYIIKRRALSYHLVKLKEWEWRP